MEDYQFNKMRILNFRFSGLALTIQAASHDGSKVEKNKKHF